MSRCPAWRAVSSTRWSSIHRRVRPWRPRAQGSVEVADTRHDLVGATSRLGVGAAHRVHGVGGVELEAVLAGPDVEAGETPLRPVDLHQGQMLHDPEQGGARRHQGTAGVVLREQRHELAVDGGAQVRQEGEQGVPLADTTTGTLWSSAGPATPAPAS